MPKLIKLQVTATVNLPKGMVGQNQGLWVHCVVAGQEGKSLGKAQTDKSGRAIVKFQIPGEKPPSLNVIVSPLSNTLKLKRVKTEKAVLQNWRKTGDTWNANVSVTLTPAFLTSVSWLDEPFVVEGELVSRYTDPQTENIVETPIRHALVKLFDVDKIKGIKPPTCIPQTICLPDVCQPRVCQPLCTPSSICQPDWTCTPNLVCPPSLVCKPDMVCIPKVPGICTPSSPGPCGPWVEGDAFDPGIWQKMGPIKSHLTLEKQGCCGSETPSAFQGLARKSMAPIMKPLSSPALPPKYAISSFLARMTVVTYKKTLLSQESETDDSGQFWFTFTRKDFFEAIAGTTHAEDVDWDEYPDLLFEARLWIDNQSRLILDEPYSDTRWNQGTYTWVKLVVEGPVPSCDPADTDITIGQTEAFLFHGVGDVEPGWIDSNGVISNAPASTSLNEHVFGGGMEILGQFKMEHVGKYYQVEYQRNGESEWHPIIGEQWYYSHYLGNGVWETKAKAPTSFMSTDGHTVYPACYQIPDYTDYTITRKTQLIAWRSYLMDGSIARYPDDLYHLRVQLLEKVGANVQPVSGFNTNANILNLRIDNHWPVAGIDSTLYLGAQSGGVLNITPVPECGFVQRGTDRYLLIHFQAEDMEKHFRSYSISVNRGADQAITIPNSGLTGTIVTNPALPDFLLSPPSYFFQSPDDNFHNAYTAMTLASDPWLPGHLLKQCAYNFTLSVWDRVTNGYGLIHYSQYTMTLTITE